jgi:hypothetical protein
MVSQVAPVAFRCDALDFVVYFHIGLHRIPVHFLQVKTTMAIGSLSARAAADDQMRLRLSQLFDQSLSELHGISTLGTRLSVIGKRLIFLICLRMTKYLSPSKIKTIKGPS